ncbi:MAG: MAPEG family protein [Janthinobacterium lividum]
MTTELYYLIWATVLGLVHVLITGQFTTLQHGFGYGLSSRDEKKEVTGIGGRVQRAYANYMQTFPYFAVAVLVAHLLNRHSSLTVLGAQLYFWSRLAFPFLYAFNVIGVRTVAWGLSTLGIVLVLTGLT